MIGGGVFFSKNRRHSFVSIFMLGGGGRGGGVMVRGGGVMEDIHLYRFSCILVDIFAYYGSFAPKRHVDSLKNMSASHNAICFQDLCLDIASRTVRP